MLSLDYHVLLLKIDYPSAEKSFRWYEPATHTESIPKWYVRFRCWKWGSRRAANGWNGSNFMFGSFCVDGYWIPVDSKGNVGPIVCHMQYTHAQTDNPMNVPRIELATALNEIMLNWWERKRELNDENMRQ